jgi:hypothetical protein
MANRSYLYGLKNNKHISIGEYPNEIPYSFKILTAYDNEIVASDLFDKKIGIKANFNKGKAALYFLLDFLSATDQMLNQIKFDDLVSKTKLFLDKIDADEILLESGEIYALYKDENKNYLNKEGLEKQNSYSCEEYKWLGEDIEQLKKMDPSLLFNLENEDVIEFFQWIIDLQNTWETELGLDAWANLLYFQFKDE